MKVLEIDSVPYGSTCKISLGIAKVAAEQGISVYTSSGYSSHPVKELPKNHYNIGGFWNKASHLALSLCSGVEGYGSVIATMKLIRFIKKTGIEAIHLHNIHGSYINYPMFFSFIKKNNIPVIWTMHDCWAVTALCPHFTMVKCDKWKTGCYQCPQYKIIFKGYWFDRSKFMWKKKKQWFSDINDLTIVTPSKWLASIIEKSYLKDNPLYVINNGIDLNIFKPTPSKFREKYQCQDKYIILGVSVSWSNRKGLDVFCELAKSIDKKFQIVLVGTNDEVDKILPDNIISIHRTQNQKELAEIYTAADVFVNPTREENFPTVNIEALACGTPIVSFETGGSSECFDSTCGCSVACDDVAELAKTIDFVINKKMYSSESCIARAHKFEMHDCFAEYVNLYETISRKGKK